MHVGFTKMHGAGNDFVVLDARTNPIALTQAQVTHFATRRYGIGCDQVIVMEPAQGAEADIFMRIYNADGSEVSACGNATRCIAWRLMEDTGKDAIAVQTKAGLLHCTRVGKESITVDMGPPRNEWHEIPLAEARDTLHLGIQEGELGDPVAVSMGNPHAVFFVSDVRHINLEAVGSILERHPLFPERANISVAEIKSPQRIRLRVWERGAGETLACGTAACAALVAAFRRGLTGNKADIELPGGVLTIEWRTQGNAHVYMTGPVATVFEGSVAL